MIDFGGNQKEEELSIDITPLVDIILQLIIFLVLTTTFIQNYNGVTIRLPHSSIPKPQVEKTQVVVGIDSNGYYYVDNKRFNLSGVIDFIKDTKGFTPAKLWVVIKADKSAPYGAVIGLIDALHKNRIDRFWLATLPEQKR